MTNGSELEWYETDCFWCGALYNPARDVCPLCGSSILTGPIEIILPDNDGED